MALQMQTVAKHTSFFKQPVSNNFFLSQRQQQNTQSHTTNTQTAQKQKEVSSELEQQTSDKLSALHTRLQLEAEKIRKWKNATEAEIKEKNKRLEEANATIESQRKSVTELQLKKETLSSRLRDEVANQKEIQRKIGSTRDMCTALKNHAVRLNDAISKGEEDRDVLTQLHKEKMDQFQGLLSRFQQLEAGQTQWMEAQAQILVEEKSLSAELRSHCESLEHKLSSTSDEVVVLKGLNEKKQVLNQHLAKEIEEKSTQLNNLIQERTSLEQILCAKEGDVNRLETELDALHQQLLAAQKQLKENTVHMSNLEETIEQNKVSYAEELAAVQSSLSASQLKCQTLETLQSDLELTLTDTKVQLNSEIENLNTKLEHTQQSLTAAEDHSLSLKSSLANETELVKQLKEERLALKDQLAEAHIDLDKLTLKMQTELQEKENKICVLKCQLEKQTSDHEASLAEWKTKEAHREECVNVLEGHKAELTEKVDLLNQELSQANSKIAELKDQHTKTSEADKDVISKLNKQKEEVCGEVAHLKQQVETVSTAKNELDKKCVTLEADNVELSKSVQSQQELVGKLQKELEVTQSDFGSKSGELSSLIDQYKKESVTAQQECADVKKSLQLQVSELQSKLESTTGELNALVDKYKREAENAKEEHEQTQSSFKEQVNELCSILERYRAEYQTVMTKKDSEIQSLRKQLEENEEDKRANEEELSSYKDKVDLLQGDLDAKTKEMTELLQAVECLQSKAKVSATPLKSTKAATGFVTPTHSTNYTDADERVVSSTPKARTGLKKLGSALATPRGPSRLISDSVRSTPQRMYKVTSTPSAKNSRPFSSLSRGKRARPQDEFEIEEAMKFKELYPEAQVEEEEAVFKKPKTKVAVRKASSTTAPKYSLCNTKYSARPPLASRNGRYKKEGKKKTEEIAWFDSDSVFGFGIDD